MFYKNDKINQNFMSTEKSGLFILGYKIYTLNFLQLLLVYFHEIVFCGIK